MHAVINPLEVRPDADWAALAVKFGDLNALIDDPDFRGCSLVRTGEAQAIVLVLFATRPALDTISSDIAAPWFAENIRLFQAKHLFGCRIPKSHRPGRGN